MDKMAKQEEVRGEVERHIRSCLSIKNMDANISDSLSKSLMVLLDGLGVVIRVDNGKGLTGCCIARLEPLVKDG